MKEQDTKEGINLAHVEKDVKRQLPLEFFFTIAKVFNPNSYEELSHRTMKDVVSYFISILFVSYVAMVLVSLPVLVSLESQLSTELSKFDELIVDLKISMNQPIYIRQLNLGIDATGDKELTQENILITKNYIQTKPLICFFKPFCWLKNGNVSKISLDEYKDLVVKKQEFVEWLYLLALFLLPWLLINLYFLLLLKFLLVALMFTVIGAILVRIVNRRVRVNRIFKIGIYSLTPMIILDTLNIPVGLNLIYIPFVISFFYFIVGVVLASERGYKR